MKPSIYLIFVPLILLSSCGAQSGAGPNASADTDRTDSNRPVETKSPNSDYAPAFAGQTRIGGVRTSTAYQESVLTKELNSPWGIRELPDGRFLISERVGQFRIVSASGSAGEAIKGIPAVNSSGQGGLLGLAIDPSFSTNRMIYWVFSEAVGGGNLTAVAKGRLSSDEKSIEQAQVIYRATPAHASSLHYGGRILFDRSGYLIVSTGERSDIVTRPQAQQLNSALGKVLRITTEGKPAPGNPFAGRVDARPEIYSYGHRNVQGLAIEPATGSLWETEFGPRGGDELNMIEPGKNYGWPTITYGLEYSGEKVGAGITKQQGLEQPVYYWDPVLSPSGICFYSGKLIPEWTGNIFISGLSSSHIARLVLRDGKVVGEERLLAGEGQRFRDITEGSDGALYAVTDAGRLYRIAKK